MNQTILRGPEPQATRATTEAADWEAFARELDDWTRSGRRATFWWRDDDAIDATPALDRLLRLSARHRAPLALAVIARDATPALAARVAAGADIHVLQHGWDHRNHAPAGAKKAELGDDRPDAALSAALAEGRRRLVGLFGERFVPVLTPPWNRIGQRAQALLPGLGYRGLTTFGARRADDTDGRVNTHLDIIDWRGTRGFAGDAACLRVVIDHLAGRRAGRYDSAEPTGLLTHHRDHDAGCWRFVARFLATVDGHSAADWLSPATLFPGDGAGH